MGLPWVYQVPSPVLGGLIVTVFVGAAIGGLWVSRRLVGPPAAAHNDLAGFLYSVVGVLYAVLLGLTAVAAWDDFQDIKRTAVQEANALQNLVHGLAAFPEPTRSHLQALSERYVRMVVTEEWPAMHRAQPSPRTQEAADALIRGWVLVQPRTPAETVLFESSLNQMQTFLAQRQLRINSAEEGIDPLMWGILLFGAALTIGFSFFFWAENVGIHAFLTGCLAALLAIIVYWILIYDHPLWGRVRVSPAPFVSILTELEAQRAAGPR